VDVCRLRVGLDLVSPRKLYIRSPMQRRSHGFGISSLERWLLLIVLCFLPITVESVEIGSQGTFQNSCLGSLRENSAFAIQRAVTVLSLSDSNPRYFHNETRPISHGNDSKLGFELKDFYNLYSGFLFCLVNCGFKPLRPKRCGTRT